MCVLCLLQDEMNRLRQNLINLVDVPEQQQQQEEQQMEEEDGAEQAVAGPHVDAVAMAVDDCDGIDDDELLDLQAEAQWVSTMMLISQKTSKHMLCSGNLHMQVVSAQQFRHVVIRSQGQPIPVLCMTDLHIKIYPS